MAEALFYLMALTPLSLNTGGRVGTWGLRQAKDIIILDDGIPFIRNPLQCLFYSPSGEVVANLTAGRGKGAKLEVTWTEEKIGGVISLELKMLKK